MRRSRWRWADAGAVIARSEVDRMISTDASCTSSHSMSFVANVPSFRNSSHRAGSAGLRPTCGDCYFNLVHAPVPPSMEFVRGSGNGRTT